LRLFFIAALGSPRKSGCRGKGILWYPFGTLLQNWAGVFFAFGQVINHFKLLAVCITHVSILCFNCDSLSCALANKLTYMLLLCYLWILGKPADTCNIASRRTDCGSEYCHRREPAAHVRNARESGWLALNPKPYAEVGFC
jgi:hypothetical protein